jgi:hypothetical protein
MFETLQDIEPVLLDTKPLRISKVLVLLVNVALRGESMFNTLLEDGVVTRMY